MVRCGLTHFVIVGIFSHVRACCSCQPDNPCAGGTCLAGPLPDAIRFIDQPNPFSGEAKLATSFGYYSIYMLFYSIKIPDWNTPYDRFVNAAGQMGLQRNKSYSQ